MFEDVSALKKDIKHRMDSSMEVFRKELAGLRTGRASAGLLEPVTVEAYGQPMPLNQVASINVPEPRMITVQVWDASQIKAVEKAIRDSNLGLNPAVDGTLIRVPIPALNEERRTELTKIAGQYAEHARVAIRNVRRDGNDNLKKLEKDGSISQDEARQHQDEIQDMTDKAIGEVDEALKHKQEEIMHV